MRKTFIDACMLLVAVCMWTDGRSQPSTVSASSKNNVLSIAYFIESANNSLNSLNSLLKKDNYRNKIATLNNPAGSELGFNLKDEILRALTPLLDKAKATDKSKFKDIIADLLENKEDNGLAGLTKLIPSTGIFSTIFSLVGNLVITEKKITREDLAAFTTKIQQYLSQYEKLNSINLQFSLQLQKLLMKTEEMKGDVKDFLVESCGMINDMGIKPNYKTMAVESILLTYYDPQRLQTWLDTVKRDSSRRLFPSDASTTVKTLASGIKKLQKEFETAYNDNYTSLKDLLAQLKTALPNIDQKQLVKVTAEVEQLYADSKQADVINLNLHLVDERMNTLTKLFNK